MAAAYRAFWHASGWTMLARFAVAVMFLPNRMLRSGMVCTMMRQAAHPIAEGHLRTGGGGQKRQGRAQQYDNNQDGLGTTHRLQGNIIFQKLIQRVRK
jgi:hypothetical protein